jgi:hypothetical protein
MVNSSSTGSVGFFNVVSIVITIVLVGLFLWLLARTLQFFKIIGFKIRIIMKNATNLKIPLFQLHYRNPELVPTQLYEKMEGLFQQEIIRSRALSFRWIFMHALDRYNHLMHFPFRRKALDDFNLLRPKASYYSFVNIAGLVILWIVAVFLAGAN